MTASVPLNAAVSVPMATTPLMPIDFILSAAPPRFKPNCLAAIRPIEMLAASSIILVAANPMPPPIAPTLAEVTIKSLILSSRFLAAMAAPSKSFTSSLMFGSILSPSSLANVLMLLRSLLRAPLNVLSCLSSMMLARFSCLAFSMPEERLIKDCVPWATRAAIFGPALSPKTSKTRPRNSASLPADLILSL